MNCMTNKYTSTIRVLGVVFYNIGIQYAHTIGEKPQNNLVNLRDGTTRGG